MRAFDGSLMTAARVRAGFGVSVDVGNHEPTQPLRHRKAEMFAMFTNHGVEQFIDRRADNGFQTVRVSGPAHHFTNFHTRQGEPVGEGR